MRDAIRLSLLGFALFIGFMVLAAFFINPNAGEREHVSAGILVEKVNAGVVERISVSGNEVSAKAEGRELVFQKEEGVSVAELLIAFGADKEKLAKVPIEVKTSEGMTFILSLIFNILPLALILFLFWQMSNQAQKGATQIFSFSRSGVKVYNPSGKEKITFKDVAGLRDAKEELIEVVEFLKSPERFFALGARIPRGVLLVGYPGTGKTMLARAVAGEANVPFFYISGSEFVEMFVGVGAGRVRDAFAMAKRHAPAILFLDEIDAVGRQRGTGIGGGHDEREQTLNQILVEMDGFERDTKAVIVAATNRPDVLDPALLRPGRFDRRVTLDLPDIAEREAIISIHLQDKKVGAVNVKQVALRTPGFSGADLANLANEAAIFAARRNKSAVEQEDLLDAIEKVMLGPEKKAKVVSKNEREIAAFHEAGHAVVAHFSTYADPVEKISIISRGRAGGYTLKLPTEERRYRFRREFLDELAVFVGGYVAEKLRFGDVTTGPHNDLEVASGLARQIVTEYGMSDLGPITFGREGEPVFLGREIVVEHHYSDDTAKRIDRQVEILIQGAVKQAEEILAAKKAILEKVAAVLIKKEVLERKQFERLVGEKKPVAR